MFLPKEAIYDQYDLVNYYDDSLWSGLRLELEQDSSLPSPNINVPCESWIGDVTHLPEIRNVAPTGDLPIIRSVPDAILAKTESVESLSIGGGRKRGLPPDLPPVALIKPLKPRIKRRRLNDEALSILGNDLTIRMPPPPPTDFALQTLSKVEIGQLDAGDPKTEAVDTFLNLGFYDHPVLQAIPPAVNNANPIKTESSQPQIVKIELNENPRKRRKKASRLPLYNKILSDLGKKRYFNPENKFVCKECSMRFVSEKNLQKHVVVSHENKGRFKCACCPRTFNFACELKVHSIVHTKIKPFKCHWKTCSKAFTKRISLTRHVQTLHQKIKPFQCKECGKVFGRKSVLVDHNRMHNGERPYECKHCHRGFTKSSGLSRHCKPKNCRKCNQEFVCCTQRTQHICPEVASKKSPGASKPDKKKAEKKVRTTADPKQRKLKKEA